MADRAYYKRSTIGATPTVVAENILYSSHPNGDKKALRIYSLHIPNNTGGDIALTVYVKHKDETLEDSMKIIIGISVPTGFGAVNEVSGILLGDGYQLLVAGQNLNATVTGKFED